MVKPRIKANQIRELSYEEGYAMVDRLARRYLNMSAAEFIEAWESGKIANPDRPEVMHVAMLLEFAQNGREDTL